MAAVAANATVQAAGRAFVAAALPLAVAAAFGEVPLDRAVVLTILIAGARAALKVIPQAKGF